MFPAGRRRAEGHPRAGAVPRQPDEVARGSVVVDRRPGGAQPAVHRVRARGRGVPVPSVAVGPGDAPAVPGPHARRPAAGQPPQERQEHAQDRVEDQLPAREPDRPPPVEDGDGDVEEVHR